MSNRPRLLLWTDAPGPYIDALAAAGLAEQVAIETLGRRQAPSDDQRTGTEIMLAPGAPPGLLPTMRALRWVQSPTAGVEGWLALPDLPADLTLTCARGTHRESMPENILAALFHVAKPFGGIEADQKRAVWGHRVMQPLNGKTLGILGLGAIGQEVARIATALNMRVIGTKRRPEAVPHAELLPTETVLQQADFLLLLLPATAQTENFLDADKLALMKQGAWVLNFGRGHLIKDEDLIAAVNAKTIAGAVLDVFRKEPLPAEHKFWSTENILVLPHIGGPHPDRDSIVAKLFTENLRRYLRGDSLLQVVDRGAGY
jgi:phosphoglycerate dehydrogenase-like enzyme